MDLYFHRSFYLRCHVLETLIEKWLGYPVAWDLTFKGIAAFGIPLTLLFGWWTHQQRSTFEMIDRLYSLCHILQSHMLHEWRLSHLFCIGDHVYYDTKRRIAEDVQRVLATPKTTDDELQKLIVEEQQFAIHIFVIYEQVYFQWKTSGLIQFRRRAFLKSMLEYFTDRLLQNPRLVAFLKADQTGEALHLEKESARYLRNKIDIESASCDATGPFNAAVVKRTASSSPSSI